MSRLGRIQTIRLLNIRLEQILIGSPTPEDHNFLQRHPKLVITRGRVTATIIRLEPRCKWLDKLTKSVIIHRRLLVPRHRKQKGAVGRQPQKLPPGRQPLKRQYQAENMTRRLALVLVRLHVQAAFLDVNIGRLARVQGYRPHRPQQQ